MCNKLNSLPKKTKFNKWSKNGDKTFWKDVIFINEYLYFDIQGEVLIYRNL